MTAKAIKVTQRQILVGTAILIVLCNLVVWAVMQRQYLNSVNAEIDQASTLAQERADDLADSIHRNLNYLDGVPLLLSELIQVEAAVKRFGDKTVPSALPADVSRVRWSSDPTLNVLSQYFKHAKSSLKVDIIYLLNAAGDCIAASNWDMPGSTVGSNFAERDFFKSNRLGLHGMQYAMGKTTSIPGLYFSSPVIIDGKFIGAVAVKVDVQNLSFLIKQSDAFVTDAYGVIILAYHKDRELLAFPNAPVTLLPEQIRKARYLRTTLPVFQMESWGDRDFPGLLRMPGDSIPQILAVTALSDYSMKVYVESGLNRFALLREENLWFTALLSALSSVVLASLCGLLLYLQSAKRDKALLWSQANFDMLTGLPNRAMFHDRLEQEVKKSDRSSQPLALMLIDLDHFKAVNDTLGHAMGDLLLKEAALRMVRCLRESDTVARLGGDEFTVVLPLLADTNDVEEVAQKIIATLALPFDLQGKTTRVSASIGISIYPRDAGTIDKLIKVADQAMYQAKDAGRNAVRFFDPAI